MHFKLKFCILYLNFQVTLITSFIITLYLCYVPGWLTQEREELKADGVHGSWILFLLEKADGHAFKRFSIFLMIHNIIHGTACYFLASEIGRRVWAEETFVGLSKMSNIFSKSQSKLKMDNNYCLKI